MAGCAGAIGPVWLPLMLGVRSDIGRDAIAAVHPDKPVAKAARKARFKLRSAGA